MLSSVRQYTQVGPQPISLYDIRAYGEIEELSYAEQRWMLKVVKKMDAFYLDFQYEKLKRERDKQPRGRQPRNRN